MIRITDFADADLGRVFIRDAGDGGVSGDVADIIADVRKRGDAALYDYALRFDGARLSSLEVTEAETDAAFAQAPPELIRVLDRAAANIREFHEKQRREGFTLRRDGVLMGQKVTPIERVGVYVPGGTAAYPSTVLMDVIPAKIAGCPEIVMTTPPRRDGSIAPAILAAAKVAGVTRIIKSGGAQAIAALAWGTESVPRVYKIVGPGNAWVAEAKRQVFGRVSIDMIAGPSEILVIADGASDARFVAADLLSQAEHDRMSSAVLLTDSRALAEAVSREIERQLPLLPREETARASIETNGLIIVVRDIPQAVDCANELAPEHLELCVDAPEQYLGSVRNAGSVFLGRHTPEALGDYLAGANHTLPTGGRAKFSSPLSVEDFIKRTQFTCYTREALADVADDIAYFAETEGLRGHARSALCRFDRGDPA